MLNSPIQVARIRTRDLIINIRQNTCFFPVYYNVLKKNIYQCHIQKHMRACHCFHYDCHNHLHHNLNQKSLCFSNSYKVLPKGNEIQIKQRHNSLCFGIFKAFTTLIFHSINTLTTPTKLS